MGVYYWTMSMFIITGVILSEEVRLAFIFNCNWLYSFQCLINVVQFLLPNFHLLCLGQMGNKNIGVIADKTGLKNKAFYSFTQELD